MGKQNNYESILEALFRQKHSVGDREVPFTREEVLDTVKALGVPRPANIGDVIYTFRYRKELPRSILESAPEGYRWIIRPRGASVYAFELTNQPPICPNPALAKIRIPDATPGVIARYAFSDEQALLAKLRYNRLIDLFTGIVCYSLQNHLRTQVKGIGQIETDELYVGVDLSGAHYVLPVQAKGHRDRIEIIQIEQDFALCSERFEGLICRAVGAQFMDDEVIALFEFVQEGNAISIREEKHYQLVPWHAISDEDLARYRTALPR